MSAIITNKFRLHNAEQFFESFTEASPSTYYLFIGRPQAFTAGTGGGTDAIPPTPVDTISDEFTYFRDMIGAKIVSSSSVTHCIPRRDWTSGTVYDQYEHNYTSSNTSTSGATNLWDATFYVMNSSYNVYKCLWNNSGGTSTNEPTTTASPYVETTADGYVWQYMYGLNTTQIQNSLSSDFMPVVIDAGVAAAATDGEITQVKIDDAGTGYTNGTYTNVPIYGDGSSGEVTVTVTGGSVTGVTVTTEGTDYTIANINVDAIGGIGTPATSASLTPIIQPKGGHGANAIYELGGFYVMMSAALVGAEGSGDLVVDNDFRRVGLIRNPYNFGTTTVATASTLSALKSMTFDVSPTPGSFLLDEGITGGTSGASGKVVHWDSGTRVLKYIQTEWTGLDSDNNLTAFVDGEVVTSDSAATGTISTSGLTDPDIEYHSGDIIYIENRAPIIRASDQTETVRLVIEF